MEARPGTPVFSPQSDIFLCQATCQVSAYMPLYSHLDGTNSSLHCDATPKKLIKTVSASATQFLPLKAGLRVALCSNRLAMQILIPLGAQSGGSVSNQDNLVGIIFVGKVKMEQCVNTVSTITSFSEDPNSVRCLLFSTTPTKLSISRRQIENMLATSMLLNQMSVELFSVTESNWHGAAYFHTAKFSSSKTCWLQSNCL